MIYKIFSLLHTYILIRSCNATISRVVFPRAREQNESLFYILSNGMPIVAVYKARVGRDHEASWNRRGFRYVSLNS